MKRLLSVLILTGAMVGIGAVSDTTQAADTSDGPVMCGGLVATIVGTMGDDIIEGQRGEDVLFGDEGDDILYGGTSTACRRPDCWR